MFIVQFFFLLEEIVELRVHVVSALAAAFLSGEDLGAKHSGDRPGARGCV